MFRHTIVKLGSGLALTLFLVTSAWAEQDYTFTVAIDSLPNADYYVIVHPAKAGAPDSVCMKQWNEPPTAQTISNAPGGQSSFQMVVKDKNSAPCTRSAKYNTWEFEIVNDCKCNDANKPPMVVGSGKFQLFHEDSSGWKTKINAINTSSLSYTPANKTFVSSAQCSKTATGAASNCLETFVGADVSNYIKILIRYPVKS